MTIISATDMSNLTPCLDGIVRTYSTSQGLKKKTAVLYCQNIIETFVIQLAYVLETKLQRGLILARYEHVFSYCWLCFQLLFV